MPFTNRTASASFFIEKDQRDLGPVNFIRHALLGQYTLKLLELLFLICYALLYVSYLIVYVALR